MPRPAALTGTIAATTVPTTVPTACALRRGRDGSVARIYLTL
jgi:hypothetical protein